MPIRPGWQFRPRAMFLQRTLRISSFKADINGASARLKTWQSPSTSTLKRLLRTQLTHRPMQVLLRATTFFPNTEESAAQKDTREQNERRAAPSSLTATLL